MVRNLETAEEHDDQWSSQIDGFLHDGDHMRVCDEEITDYEASHHGEYLSEGDVKIAHHVQLW